jgi:hypothetical protein
VGEAGGGNEKPPFVDDGDGDRDGGSGNMYASAETSTRNGVGEVGWGGGAGSEVGTGGKASTGGGEVGSAFAGTSAA